MWLLPLCTQHCAPGLTPRTLPRSTGKFGGSTSSFLFSITKDCKLPSHGRIKGPPQAGDIDDTPAAASPASRSRDAALLRAAGVDDSETLRRLDESGAGGSGYGGLEDDGETKGTEGRRTDCLRSTPDSLQFGVRDLVFKVRRRLNRTRAERRSRVTLCHRIPPVSPG